LAALRVIPEDAEVRFLLAGGYARLGLRTAAIEQLDRLPEQVQGDPNVEAMRRAAGGLPGDRVGLDELERTVRGNVEALRGRGVGPVDLRGFVEEWRKRAAGREWFRTGSGDLAWRVPGNATTWERLGNQRAQAAGLRLEHDASPTGAGCPPPYFVEGMDPPWVFERLYDSTPARYDGHASLIVAAQHDEVQFLDGLAHAAMAEKLGAARVRVFVGTDAGERLERFVRERTIAGMRTMGPAIALPTTGARIAPGAERIMAEAMELARRDNEELSERMASMYPPRDRAFWAVRFASALSGRGEPLRVLIPTSRYSTFLRHSGADLADALEKAGCVVRVHMEGDDHAMNDAAADMRAVVEHRPDLIVLPNYLRANLGTSYPAHVPFVTWVQDAMPHLYAKDVGEKVGPLDFVVGHLREEMFQKFGYPRGRAMAMPMAASVRKFHDGAAAPGAESRHACEIAYVSHHAQTPEELHRRRREEAPAGEGSNTMRGMLDALLPRILGEVEGGIDRGPMSVRLRAMTVEELRRAGLPDEGPVVAAMLSVYTMQIADRAMRHRTLEWAARIARRRGWRMHLYGRGWETHPTLGGLAKGELQHGEDLRACYKTARAHLHMSAHTAVHQRVFECALSGGLALSRLQSEDLSQLEYLAAAHACRVCEPVASNPWVVARMGYRLQAYPVGSCEEARRYGEFVRDMGLAERSLVWLSQIHAERLRSSPTEMIDGVGHSLLDLWPDAAAVMFHDEETLGRVLLRAVEDEAWREEQSRAMGELARRLVTYDALVGTMLRFVGARLAGEGERAARWYDGSAERAVSVRPGNPALIMNGAAGVDARIA
jgi:hypothetical protein